MKRPIFFWTKSVIATYARLHVKPDDHHSVVEDALSYIRSLPFKYFALLQLTCFIVEFMVPLFYGYVSRFSKLSEPSRLTLVQSLQASRCFFGGVMLNFFRTPILLSMKMGGADERV